VSASPSGILLVACAWRLNRVPREKKRNPLEFAVKLPGGNIKVEVKAPHQEIKETFWWGNDSASLQEVLKKANDQFNPDDRNLLVIVPTLRVPVFHFRTQIEQAFIGEEVIQIPIDIRTGGPAGPDRLVFKESGLLAKKWKSKDERTLLPRFTRVGAILSLEEWNSDEEVIPKALIVHNPNAKMPLPKSLWEGIPEFYCDKLRGWRWSDVA
jgi:hypothetical protein